MTPTTLASLCAAAAVALAAPAQPGGYAVFVDGGAQGEFLPAAKAMAALHEAAMIEFDAAAVGRGEVEDLLAMLRAERPRAVVFVVPPALIDVEFSRRILEVSVRVDDDPFVDFEYGFVTGRDGPAASAFVARIAAAHRRQWGNRSALFGTWEGPVLPRAIRPTALEAMGLEAAVKLIHMMDEEQTRQAAARRMLGELAGMDSLLFFSHGYPGEMVGCYTGAQLREWKVDLSPAVVFNSSCYNGAPGRWWMPEMIDGKFAMAPRDPVPPEESAALAMLDAGVSGAFLGVDPWHGPLTCQVYALAVDDGLTLGGAAKRMFDRLAIDFLPGPIAFAPVAERTAFGEGVENRRSNGAGMIFYGDPTLRIADENRRSLLSSSVEFDGRRLRITITSRPMVSGFGGPDAMVPMWRLCNYYSVRTGDAMRELAPEIYQVVDLPEDAGVGAGGDAVAMRVVSAKVAADDLPVGEPQAIVEEWHGGIRRLHVRIPIAARMLGEAWTERVMRQGVHIVVEQAEAEE